jgi:hypothetical protein
VGPNDAEKNGAKTTVNHERIGVVLRRIGPVKLLFMRIPVDN